MMKVIVLTLAIIGLAMAAPGREKRQANCVDPFQNVPSPCTGDLSQRLYYPHPTDNTKFLQCDVFGRMYIIQCPQGEEYQSAGSSCKPKTAVATQAPFVPPVVTRAPVTQGPVSANPCTASAISRGTLYFPLQGDKTRFVECDLAGNPSVLACATGLLWDQGMLSCVYPINAGVGANVGQVTPSPGSAGASNPCVASAINSGHFFFPYPGDATKFIQCDLWGNRFEVSCPSSLIWNAYQETCYKPAPVANVGK